MTNSIFCRDSIHSKKDRELHSLVLMYSWRNSTWPCCSFRLQNSKEHSVTFLRQRQLFLLENQTSVFQSPLLLKEMFVWRSTVNFQKCLSWRPLDRSTSWIMIGPSECPNVCEFSSIPNRSTALDQLWSYFQGFFIFFPEVSPAFQSRCWLAVFTCLPLVFLVFIFLRQLRK